MSSLSHINALTLLLLALCMQLLTLLSTMCLQLCSCCPYAG